MYDLFVAGYAAAQPAPADDALLASLENMERQATPAPWTNWVGTGKIFYGIPDKNRVGHYSPGNLELFEAENYDRDNLDTEIEGFNIQPGTAEDDASFVAALRNAAAALLARVRQAEARVAWVPATLTPCVLPGKDYSEDVLLWYDETVAPQVGYYDYRPAYRCYVAYDADLTARPSYWQRIVCPNAGKEADRV